MKQYTRHGRRHTPEYNVWANMKQRCLNPNHSRFKDYGGRGIKICDTWLRSFQLFYEDMGHRPVGTSLDRVNNHGNYEPSNCRWATQFEQRLNTRRNRFITVHNETRTLCEWSKSTGINRSTLASRLKKYPPEIAICIKLAMVEKSRG